MHINSFKKINFFQLLILNLFYEALSYILISIFLHWKSTETPVNLASFLFVTYILWN
jgi:hypothetical protein